MGLRIGVIWKRYPSWRKVIGACGLRTGGVIDIRRREGKGLVRSEVAVLFIPLRK